MDSRCAEAQFEEKEFSSKKIIISLFLFRNLSDKSVVFWRKIFGRVAKIAFSVAWESFLMKTISDKKNCNSILFGLWETLSYFWRQSYGRLVKNSLYVFRRRFLQLNFLEGLLIFPHFRKSSKNFSEFWRQNFGRVVTTALYMYIGTFLGKLFSFRKVQCFFRGFRNLSCQSVDCRRKLFAIVVKIACSVAKESFLMKKISLFEKF